MMNKEEIKELINSIEERLIVSQTINEPINTDLDKAIKLSVAYEQLKEENERLINTYKSLIKRQYELGNDEFARYLEAQICDCNTFVPQKTQELESSDHD